MTEHTEPTPDVIDHVPTADELRGDTGLIDRVPSADELPEAATTSSWKAYDRDFWSDLSNPNMGDEYWDEVDARRTHHAELLNADPVVQGLKQRAEDIDYGDTVIFELDKEGKIANPVDLAALGLPELPDDTHEITSLSPVAVLLAAPTKKDQPNRVTVVAINEFGDVRLRHLEDMGVTTDSGSFKPRWRTPNDSKMTGSGSVWLMPSGKNDEVVRMKVTYKDAYDVQAAPEKVQIVRSESSAQEQRLAQSSDKVEKRVKRLGGVQKALAGITLLSALGTVTQEKVPEPAPIPELEEVIESEHALARFSANYEAFTAGDTEALDEVIASSEFSKILFGFEEMQAVERAENFEDLEAAMTEALGQYDIDFRIMHEDEADEYFAVGSDRFDEAKSSAFGVMDGLNEMGLLAIDGKPFDIELVGSLPDHEDEDGSGPDGTYIHARDGNDPIIRIRMHSNSRGRISDITRHEVGHHEHLGDFTISDSPVRQLNPEDFQYGKDGTGEFSVGEDVITAYASTNEREDVAEMVEYLLGDSPRIADEAHERNVLQAKLAVVMIELEDEYPGASAVILRNAERVEDNQVISNIEHTIDTMRANAHRVLVLSVMAGLGVSVAYANARQTQRKQLELTNK